MSNQLPLTPAEIAAIQADYPNWQQAYHGGQPTAIFVYTLNPASISLDNLNVDNSGVESRLGNTDAVVVAAGANGSLNALLKRVTLDLTTQGAGWLPGIWQATAAGTGYTIGDYLRERLVIVNGAVVHRWYVLNSAGALTEIAGDVPVADRVLTNRLAISVGSTVEAPSKDIRTVTGTIAAASDTTVIDLSSLSGVSAGDKIVITGLRIQNENGTANTVVLKDGTTTIARIYTETAGSGVDRQYAIGRELRLSPDADFILTPSDAGQIGYSVEFFLES